MRVVRKMKSWDTYLEVNVVPTVLVSSVLDEQGLRKSLEGPQVHG